MPAAKQPVLQLLVNITSIIRPSPYRSKKSPVDALWIKALAVPRVLSDPGL
jgi:hypothetical protein